MNPQIQLERERQEYRKGQPYPGVLGDDNGNVYAGRSHYWVKFPQGVDENGQTTYGAARAVRFNGNAGVIPKGGVRVLVWIHEYDGIETIKEVDPGWWGDVGIDSRIVNSGEPVSKWWDSPNFIRWLNRPTGSSASTSTLTTTRENPFYWDDAQEWATFAATAPSAQLDLASFIPAADTHRLVITYFDVLAGAAAAVGSTAQALSSDLDLTDYLECRALLPHNECVPLTAYELADAQTTIDQNAVTQELRSWLSLPQVVGFPNPIPSGKAWLLRDTHQQIVYNLTVVGQLTIEGNMTVL